MEANDFSEHVVVPLAAGMSRLLVSIALASRLISIVPAPRCALHPRLFKKRSSRHIRRTFLHSNRTLALAGRGSGEDVLMFYLTADEHIFYALKQLDDNP